MQANIMSAIAIVVEAGKQMFLQCADFYSVLTLQCVDFTVCWLYSVLTLQCADFTVYAWLVINILYDDIIRTKALLYYQTETIRNFPTSSQYISEWLRLCVGVMTPAALKCCLTTGRSYL